MIILQIYEPVLFFFFIAVIFTINFLQAVNFRVSVIAGYMDFSPTAVNYNSKGVLVFKRNTKSMSEKSFLHCLNGSMVFQGTTKSKAFNGH